MNLLIFYVGWTLQQELERVFENRAATTFCTANIYLIGGVIGSCLPNGLGINCSAFCALAAACPC
jgi:hypothetical protein